MSDVRDSRGMVIVPKHKLKTTLNKRAATLISQGIRSSGNYTDGFFRIEEQLYCDEANSVYTFCKWLDEQDRNHTDDRLLPLVESNYPNIYKKFFLKEYTA